MSGRPIECETSAPGGETVSREFVSEVIPRAIFQRRKGLRRLRMSFDYENRLIIAVPWNCSMRKARDFVESNRDWVIDQAASLSPVLSLEEHFSRSPFISMEGRRIAVSIRRVEAGRSQWIYDEKRAEGLFQLRNSDPSETALRKLLRKVAAVSLEQRVRDLASMHGFEPGRVTVRDQKSRWGSCSRNGTISLNWRLLLFSPGAQDHVILHELAHLRHLDHSKNFHQLLSSLDPQRTEHEAELDRDGARWMRVDR